MKPPIYVYETGDLTVFTSVDDVHAHLEPVDVYENRYVAYDSEGRLLKLSARDKSFRYPITVTAEEVPTHQTELRNLLVPFLQRLGTAQESITDAKLEELVEMSLPYRFEVKQWPSWLRRLVVKKSS
jgi:hypothetical protein